METQAVQEKKTKSAPKRAPYGAQRVKAETKKKIKAMLAQLNRKDFGKRIHGDALIVLALSLLTPEHLKHLQDASLSEHDRLERDYRAYVAKHGPMSKDEYLGGRLRGKIAEETSHENAPAQLST